MKRTKIHSRYRRHLRSLLLLRDGSICHYCGRPTGKLTMDHVVPLSKGGTNALENLVLACWPCNNAKGTLTLDEFVAVAR